MSILSGDTIMQLNNSAVDAGANFLVGAATSPFDPNFSVQNAGAMSVVGGTVGVASGAANIVGSGIGDAALTANIVAAGMQNISNLVTSYIADATAKLATIPMDKFSEAMSEAVTSGTFKPADIVKKLSQGAEDFQKGVAEEMEKAQQEKIKTGASTKIQELSKKASDTLISAEKQLNSIASYTSKGPKWMESQIKKLSDLVIEQFSGNVDKTIKDFDTIKNDWAESAGKSAGQKIVNPINDKLVKAQKDILDKIDKNKNQAINKAKASIAQALMKVKGLLGG